MIPFVEEYPGVGIRKPLCRPPESTGWVTYGRYNSGIFINLNVLFCARALPLSMSTVNLSEDSIQSGFGSWHEVTVPS